MTRRQNKPKSNGFFFGVLVGIFLQLLMSIGIFYHWYSQPHVTMGQVATSQAEQISTLTRSVENQQKSLNNLAGELKTLEKYYSILRSDLYHTQGRMVGK